MTVDLIQPIPVDRGSLRAQIDDKILALVPGFDTTSPLTVYDLFAEGVVDVVAQALATLNEGLSNGSIGLRGSLEKVDRVFQRDAVQATATATLTRDLTVNDDEQVVPAGTPFLLLGSDGIAVEFQIPDDETFLATEDEVSVELIAALGGTGGNGLTTVIGPAQTVSWFLALVLDAPTSGGEDAEDDVTYLNRGAEEKTIASRAINLPKDLAKWLRSQPGVDRAQVINNYNADTSTEGVGGHMTAIPIDEDGNELSGGSMTALEAAAQEIAVTDGIIHIIAPTDTLITVVFAGVAETGFDAADVETRAEQAVLDFLDRSRFGLPKSGDERDWLDVRVVRYQDVITALNNVQGFDHYTSLTINGGTSDVSLAGPGALPDAASTASGTVT